jgi:H+/Cl- antiporter ClcA
MISGGEIRERKPRRRRLALFVWCVVAVALLVFGAISTMFGAEIAFWYEGECRGNFSLFSSNPHCWGPPFWLYSGIVEVLVGVGLVVFILLVTTRARRDRRPSLDATRQVQGRDDAGAQ